MGSLREKCFQKGNRSKQVWGKLASVPTSTKHLTFKLYKQEIGLAYGLYSYSYSKYDEYLPIICKYWKIWLISNFLVMEIVILCKKKVLFMWDYSCRCGYKSRNASTHAAIGGALTHAHHGVHVWVPRFGKASHLSDKDWIGWFCEEPNHHPLTLEFALAVDSFDLIFLRGKDGSILLINIFAGNECNCRN